MHSTLFADGAGTELGLAVDAAKELENDGKKCRVVSMVSWELFEEQDQQYKVSVVWACPPHQQGLTLCLHAVCVNVLIVLVLSTVCSACRCCEETPCLPLCVLLKFLLINHYY